jgi:hypothetical protein
MRLSWFLVKPEVDATDIKAIIEGSDGSEHKVSGCQR